MLTNEDKALLSFAQIFIFGLFLQRHIWIFDDAFPGYSTLNEYLNGCLTPLKEIVWVVGQPDESLGAEQVLKCRLTLVFVLLLNIHFELVSRFNHSSIVLLLSFFFLAFALSVFALFIFFLFVFLLMVMLMTMAISILVHVRDAQNEVIIQQFSKSLCLKWPLCFVYEARHSIFLSLWTNVIAILLKPLSMICCFFKIECSSIDDLFEVNIALDSFNDLGPRVKLFDGFLDSFFILVCDHIAFVHQNDICKFDLLTQQMEYLSRIIDVNIIELVYCQVL